ncbi:MAG: signal peptidase I [Methylorubrum populi]
MTTIDLAKKPGAKRGGFLELAGLAVATGICVALLSVGPFLFRVYSIPSTSTAPGIVVGDYVVVSRYAYGFSRYSLPLSDVLPYPLAGTLLPGALPKRGDIIVFKLPKDNATDYIKRVVGLPGDTIQMIEGVLTINGKPVKRERVADYELVQSYGKVDKVAQYEETLPGGATFRVIERDGDRSFYDNTEVYEVPARHVFTLGDNRDNSVDSRDLASVGYVPIRNLVGRADLVLFSFADAAGGNSSATAALRWSRFMAAIR